MIHGDFLRLDVTMPNSGNQGGTGPNGFPNGRRLADDVIDILLNIITNGALTTGDNVNANDVLFGKHVSIPCADAAAACYGNDRRQYAQLI